MKTINNYLFYNDNLTSSGMPTSRQIRSIAKRCIQVVINLARSDAPSTLSEEREMVEGLGMQYISIPVDWNLPSTDKLKEFMDAMDTNKDKKIHVHCEVNFRSSAFIALYRILRLGWGPDEAIAGMGSIWDEKTYPTWKTFIDSEINKNTSKI